VAPESDASLVARDATTRYVFAFGDGDRGDVTVLGGKGAGLAHMTRLRLPVPPGFVVSTRAGREFLAEGAVPQSAVAEIDDHLATLEAQMGRRLGDPRSPLLVSVRSGAPVSMPGMMDTVLNVGLNADTVRALAEETGNERFAWDCYERLVEEYARIVRGVDPGELEDRLMDLGGAATPPQIVDALRELVAEHDGRPIPHDPRAQILEAVAAVFGSWDSPRAKAYRRFRGIDDGLATAAIVQVMVFGNRGETSASGVAFTRDPSTGASGAFGDVLFNAQGEEVVAGERDAEPLDAMAQRLPEAHSRLQATLRTIEEDAGDLCEVEFTVEERNLWILQTRIGLRSGRAAVRVAVELVNEGRISIEEAISRITPAQLEAAGAPGLPTAFPEQDTIAAGLAASPGAATGTAVFDPARATELAAQGHDVVLLRPTTSPGDVAGFIAARAVVTGRGGRTSHAAVVARGMHRPAICGVGELRVSEDRRTAGLAGVTLREGDVVTVDGDRGLLARGRHELGAPVSDPAVKQMLAWCSERATVPALAPGEVAMLPSVDSLDELRSHDERVVLRLEDPGAVPAVELAKSLQARDGAAPVLQAAAAWLRAADVPPRGRVTGIVVPEKSLSAVLLQATLTPDERL
jgi:pyruvate,orthophosphate dikinase